MGRSEKEIDTASAALRDLAQWLRNQRARAGLTYRELADRAGMHATTLQRVASGNSVPRLVAVLAYARGCDASPAEARRLWQVARRQHVRSAAGAGRDRRPVPPARLVRDFADLSAALQWMYEEACAPPLRIMEQRAGQFGALPRSSAHRIVTRQTVPHSLEQFLAFLRACEIPVSRWKDWEEAWSRAWRFEKQEDAGLGEAWFAPASQPRPRISYDPSYEDPPLRIRRARYQRPMAPRQRTRPPEPMFPRETERVGELSLRLAVLRGKATMSSQPTPHALTGVEGKPVEDPSVLF
ncbi:helix-turn-helix transcriptional regulator [uncultured Streptomyces sp.]|uniref:helix-turn-helix domain-containing protein n=1 Tax=uncultured Streptomyces sp. TaxID=174707 RepID=UPI003425A01F